MEALPLAETGAALIRAGQECGRNRQPRPCMGRGWAAVGALREGGSCRWKKIGQFSKIRCNLPPHRIQYKYRAGPIDADGSSAYIFIGRMILTCGGTPSAFLADLPAEVQRELRAPRPVPEAEQLSLF